jgi:pSer/pThr/pTyr-binding forkhead associated (FHA) protein
MSKIFKIGRESDNDIVISDQTVSRNHGIIYFEPDGSTYFEDLNSSNGSFVNGNKIYGRVQLQNTDILKVGKALVPWQEYRHLTPSASSDIQDGATIINEQEAYIPQSNANDGHTMVDNEPLNYGGASFEPVKQKNGNFFKKYWPVFLGVFALLVGVLVVISRIGDSNPTEEVSALSSDTTVQEENPKTPEVYEEFSDSDGDGVEDSDDECPNKKGPKKNNGCPVKDYDGDGTPDADDNCVYEYGPKSNYGCPYEEDSYRTQCPYCYAVTYQSESNRYWTCGSCDERFYNCYKTSAGDHGGVKTDWFYDGDCDCYNCDDE